MYQKLPQGSLNELWASPSNWRLGVIYVCKDDPRLVVPKRFWKWGGWTINFAHASAWALLMAIVAVGAIPATILSAAQLWNPWLWMAYVVGFTVFVCVLAVILASPARYESGG